jgi:pimeloyl-ACP methyl ester carboxylesterase
MADAVTAQTEIPRRRLLPAGGDGVVHVRSLGEGPPLILLHECPRSSLSLLPLLRELAPDFCCLALDTPGYGHSSPLADTATMAEFADRVCAAMDRLGLQTAHFYGTHTGAAIALEIARRAPERVAQLVLDGPPVFSATECESMLAHYLPPIDATRDGRHLATLWARVTDQQVFFPFYRRDAAARSGGSGRDLAAAQRSMLGFLTAGEHYVTAYRAAITYPTALATAAIPADSLTLLCQRSDMLAPHLARLALPGTLVDDVRGVADCMREALARRRLPTFTLPPSAQSSGDTYLDSPEGSLRCQCPDSAVSPGSFGLLDPLRRRAAAQGPAIDLVGLGDSADGVWPWTARADVTRALSVAATALGGTLDTADRGTQAVVFLLALVGVPLPPPLRGVPLEDAALQAYSRALVAPEWGGGHVHAAWGLARELVEDPVGGSPFRVPGSDAEQLDAIERLALYLLRSLPFLLHATGSRAPGQYAGG